MRRSIRWLVIAISAFAMPLNGLAATAGALGAPEGGAAKSYAVKGALDLVGNASYTIDTATWTITMRVDRLENDSASSASDSIRIELFVTRGPIADGESFWYAPLAVGTLAPLEPLAAHSNVELTTSIKVVPNGIYYVYLGAFENENGCEHASGYCLDDYVAFAGRVQVFDWEVADFVPPEGTAEAIEFRHAGYGHYFVTANPDEIAALDSGLIAGWTRTGESFGVWKEDADLAAVCRFHTTLGGRSSHFLSADAAECDAVKQNPDWQFEGIAFRLRPFADGSCAPRLYRLYNNGMTGTPNHRYTTSIDVRAQTMQQGFVAEDANTACAAY